MILSKIDSDFGVMRWSRCAVSDLRAGRL